MIRKEIALLASLLFIAGPSAAITLNDYVADVIQSNPQVLQRIHSYRQVIEDEHVADSGWRPSVDLTASTGAYSTNSPITGFNNRDYDSSNVALTLTQNLFNGYDTTHAQSQSQSRINSALYSIYDEADNVAIDAIAAYIDALKQRRLVKLAERNVESHERILWKIRKRSSSGVGRLSEVEQIEGRLAQAHASMIAQQNNLQDALTRLHYSLGRYVPAEELENPEMPVMPQEALNLQIDQALAKHPAMKVASYNVEANEFEHKRTKSKFYPKVDFQLKKMLGTNLSGYDGDTDETSALLNLSYNLYNGGADQADRQKKVSQVFEQREYSAHVRRQIIENLRLAWMAGDALTKQLEHLDNYVKRAGTTVDFYHEEFFIGQRDLLDLLDAEGEVNTAMMRRAEAHYDALGAVYRIYEGKGELFLSLSLGVEMSADNLRLVSLETKGVDTLPFAPDIDVDKEMDVADHCDNTLAKNSVNKYGCHDELNDGFGYRKIRLGELNIESLNFIFDTDILTEESSTRLEHVIADLKELPLNVYVEIYAHTDDWGSAKYNLSLSQRRAIKVQSLLVEAGFDPAMTKAVGYGEEKPIAGNDTDEGRAQNRRVEFLPRELGKN